MTNRYSFLKTMLAVILSAGALAVPATAATTETTSTGTSGSIATIPMVS